VTSPTPNIVFIITDQQRFDTIRELGYDHAITPNLDRLVREGCAFTRTYVTAPSCSPSRASLFNGVYPHTLGVLRNHERWTHSWVESLAEAGYHCVNVGKMHTYPYDAPTGFHERHVVENKDRTGPISPFFLDQWDKAFWTRGIQKPGRDTYRPREDYRESLGAFAWELPEDLHADNFVGGLATMWLDRYTSDEPFFLQIGFPGPHPPYDPIQRYVDLYDDVEIPLPHRDADDLASQPEPLQELRQDHISRDRDAIVHLENPTDAQLRRQRAHYLANVTMIDEQIGRLIDALERRGVLDDTVIVFTSDHGDALGDHGHSQKWTMYEPSVHVPAIVWGPGRVEAGRRLDGLASHMDLGPTLLELAGLEPPEWMEAESLLPALQGSPWSGREQVFSEHARDSVLSGTELMTMVRDQRYKLVEFLDTDEGQLFDLDSDPDELHDLWDDPDLQTVKAGLLQVISRWRATSAIHTASRMLRHR
jgi:arylsulfatase